MSTKPGDDGLAGEVDRPGAGRDVQGAGRPHRGDPVVADQDVGPFDHACVGDGDHAGSGQQRGPARDVPLGLDLDPDFGGFVAVVVFSLLFSLLFVLRFFRLPGLVEGLRRVQVVGEERATERPVDGAPTRCPRRLAREA